MNLRKIITEELLNAEITHERDVKDALHTIPPDIRRRYPDATEDQVRSVVRSILRVNFVPMG